MFTNTESCGILLLKTGGPKMTEKSKKITVLLEPSEFQQFDRFCRVQGFKKSTLLVRLIREFLDRELAEEDGPRPLLDQKAIDRNGTNRERKSTE
jgi:hypothetical protein